MHRQTHNFHHTACARNPAQGTRGNFCDNGNDARLWWSKLNENTSQHYPQYISHEWGLVGEEVRHDGLNVEEVSEIAFSSFTFIEITPSLPQLNEILNSSPPPIRFGFLYFEEVSISIGALISLAFVLFMLFYADNNFVSTHICQVMFFYKGHFHSNLRLVLQPTFLCSLMTGDDIRCERFERWSRNAFFFPISPNWNPCLDFSARNFCWWTFFCWDQRRFP